MTRRILIIILAAFHGSALAQPQARIGRSVSQALSAKLAVQAVQGFGQHARDHYDAYPLTPQSLDPPPYSNRYQAASLPCQQAGIGGLLLNCPCYDC